MIEELGGDLQVKVNSAPKRRNVSRACFTCRKAKAKCDQGRPCSRCTRLKLEESCNDGPPPRKRGPKRSIASTSSLEEYDDDDSPDENQGYEVPNMSPDPSDSDANSVPGELAVRKASPASSESPYSDLNLFPSSGMALARTLALQFGFGLLPRRFSSNGPVPVSLEAFETVVHILYKLNTMKAAGALSISKHILDFTGQRAMMRGGTVGLPTEKLKYYRDMLGLPLMEPDMEEGLICYQQQSEMARNSNIATLVVNYSFEMAYLNEAFIKFSGYDEATLRAWMSEPKKMFFMKFWDSAAEFSMVFYHKIWGLMNDLTIHGIKCRLRSSAGKLIETMYATEICLSSRGYPVVCVVRFIPLTTPPVDSIEASSSVENAQSVPATPFSNPSTEYTPSSPGMSLSFSPSSPSAIESPFSFQSSSFLPSPAYAHSSESLTSEDLLS